MYDPTAISTPPFRAHYSDSAEWPAFSRRRRSSAGRYLCFDLTLVHLFILRNFPESHAANPLPIAVQTLVNDV